MEEHFFYTTIDNPKASILNESLREEYDARYGDFFDPGGAIVEMQRYPVSDFVPVKGNFLLLMRGEEVLGGGGFKLLDQQTAEIKRVWTNKLYRRQGIAEKILEELEIRAAAQGYRQLYLTTGCRQPEAVELYLKHGYKNLFNLKGDWELLKKLPFVKDISHLVSQQEAQ